MKNWSTKVDWWTVVFIINGMLAVALPNLTNDSPWSDFWKPIVVIAMIYGGTNALLSRHKKTAEEPWDGVDRRQQGDR